MKEQYDNLYDIILTGDKNANIWYILFCAITAFGWFFMSMLR